MKITYLNHSSFFMEYSANAILIDYGELPRRPTFGNLEDGVFELSRQKDKYKKLFGYSSHRHIDHFDPDLIKQFLENDLLYILSDEQDLEFEDYMQNKNFCRLLPNTTANINILNFANTGSTDQGGAVLLQDRNETFSIYYGGDLAVWDDLEVFYEGFAKEFNWLQTQVNRFAPVKVAFLPCCTSDGYQEEPLLNGSKDLISLLKPQIVIPMHGYRHEYFYKSFAEEMKSRLKDISTDVSTFSNFNVQNIAKDSTIIVYPEKNGDSIEFNSIK